MTTPRVVECACDNTGSVVNPPRSESKKRQRRDQSPAPLAAQPAPESTRQRKHKRRNNQPQPAPVEVIDLAGDSSTDENNPLDPPAPSSDSSTTRPALQKRAPRMEQVESDDYFQVLGLPRSATDADVKKAYRKLAIQWHPDKNRDHPKAEEYFKRVAEAYEVLSDPEKRKHYERFGKQGPEGGHTGGGFHDASFDYHGGFTARHARDIFEAFFGGRDPFSEMFGGGSRARTDRRRQPRHPFEEEDGFGFGFGMPMMGFGMMNMGFEGGGGGGFGGGGGGGSRRGGGGFGIGGGLLDSFFSDDFGGGFSGSFSQSVSTTSFTERNGHVVTKKTTTMTNADGRSDTVTEEYRNGKLVNSSSSSSNRLATAGRLQLDSGKSSSTNAQSTREEPRNLPSGGRSRSNRA